MSATYEKNRLIDHLIRKEQRKRDELVEEDLATGFYDSETRQNAMYNSINEELELRSKKSRLHKKSTGHHLRKRDRHYLMEQDKKRLEPQHPSHELNRFYALVKQDFIVEDIQDLRIERLKWMLAGAYKDQDQRALSRVVETILEETNALSTMQILGKKSKYPGDGTGDVTQKTQHELLKETLRECVGDLAEQDGWTMAKAQEAYGYVKQALVGGVGVDHGTASIDERSALNEKGMLDKTPKGLQSGTMSMDERIRQDIDEVNNVSEKSKSEDQALDLRTYPVTTSQRVASAVLKWLLPVLGIFLGCVIYWI